MNAELTILVDNLPVREGMRAEHGLAILIRGPGRTLLFDAALTWHSLADNARQLGVDLRDVQDVVISHGHCDHTGSLGQLAALRPGLNVYAHPTAFLRRWVDHPGRPLRDISCPHTIQKLAQHSAVLHAVRAPEMLADWLVLSGPVGGPRHGHESFVVRKGDDLVVDNFEDELFAVVRGQEGWAVITGCCHRGLRNTLRVAQFITRQDPLKALVGGLHLRNADTDELREAMHVLEDYPGLDIYPCHCTGDKAVEFLSHYLPGRIHQAGAGTVIRI